MNDRLFCEIFNNIIFRELIARDNKQAQHNPQTAFFIFFHKLFYRVHQYVFST